MPEVWIKKVGVELDERPAAMAVADGTWSQFAQSGWLLMIGWIEGEGI